MKILSRYILREYLVPLAYCLAGFISIYVLFELFGSFSRLLDAKLPLTTTFKYFLAYLSPFFHYLAPAALMLAALYTMWNFCRHSELVAMRASGVGFLTISLPILAVSVVMALFVAWVNESYVPAHAQWAKRLRAERFDQAKAVRSGKIVYCNTRANRIWTAESSFDPSGRHLAQVRVTEDRPDGGARLFTLTADRADWLDGEWWFTGQNVHHYDISGAEVATKAPELDKLPLRVMPELNERPADLMAQNRGQFNSVREKFRSIKTNDDMSADKRRDTTYEAWSQIMSPFACIVITLFAIPAGIASGRQSVFKGIVGALLMFFAFYAVVIGGMVGANKGWLPPILAAVLPYAIFLWLGIRAFRKQR